MKIESLLEEILAERVLSATLSNPFSLSDGSIDMPLKKTIRQMLIKNKVVYQISNHYSQKVFHTNLSPIECMVLIKESLFNYRQGLFQLSSYHIHVLVSKNRELKILKKNIIERSHAELCLSHNRHKKYTLKEGVAVPFLIELGIMQENGQIIAKKYDKFKQINKFIEMVQDVLPQLPLSGSIEIIDFGCGKASLTFALYHYLRHIANREISIVGYDLKADVITTCQELAKRLGYTALNFVVGDINDHRPLKKVDMVISLHACDTATDAALEKAVHWDASVILCIPCCQHELYTQIKSVTLHSILKHGILKERFAALVTDAARADLLEILGYDVQIVEFIDMEHTPKNLLIRATKQPSLKREHCAKNRYLLLAEALQITPSLQRRFPALFA